MMVGDSGAAIADWYQVLDVVVRCILFTHFIYSLILWFTPRSSQPDDDLPDNVLEVLTALDDMFGELLTEVDKTSRTSTDEDRSALRRLLTSFRTELNVEKLAAKVVEEELLVISF